jgi:rubrerythrin
MRERQRMSNSDTGRTLAGTTFRYECRICGADHGEERHTDCPECGRSPYEVEDVRNTSWSSKRVEIVE